MVVDLARIQQRHEGHHKAAYNESYTTASGAVVSSRSEGRLKQQHVQVPQNLRKYGC